MGSPVSPEADPEMRFKCKGFIPELAPEETSMEPGKHVRRGVEPGKGASQAKVLQGQCRGVG